MQLGQSHDHNRGGGQARGGTTTSHNTDTIVELWLLEKTSSHVFDAMLFYITFNITISKYPKFGLGVVTTVVWVFNRVYQRNKKNTHWLMYYVFTPKSRAVDESIQGFNGYSKHISSYISSLTLYNEKFTRDLDRFLANISTPHLLKWTLSHWKYAGIEGHGSIHKILFRGSDLLTRIEFRLSIFLSICRRHGWSWLMKTDACG